MTLVHKRIFINVLL